MKLKILFFTFMIFNSLIVQASGELSDKEVVKSFYESLTGVSPNKSEVQELLPLYEAGNYVSLGRKIVDPPTSNTFVKNYGAFYSVTVKNFAAPWSNEEGTTLVPLNDMSATVIGYTRDEKPFHESLYKDVVYKASGTTFAGGLKYFAYNANPNTYTDDPAVTDVSKQPKNLCAGVTPLATNTDNIIMYMQDPEDPNNPNARLCQATKYKTSELIAFTIDNALYLPHLDTVIETNLIKPSNKHYESIENQALDLSDPKLLKPTSQMVKLHQYEDAVSGIMTTRAYGIFYSAGTNRAPFAYSMRNFFCMDMEELNDTTIPDYRNRRDIDRSPGGDSTLYKNRCIGCHAGMDAMSGAFAYYDYNGALLYTPQSVHPKMNHNVVFPDGFVTQSDSWQLLWNQGKNASLGWGTPTQGNGVKSLAQMFASTDSFNTCMSKQVAETVCFKVKRKMKKEIWDNIIAENAAKFKADKNMKLLFINTAISCMEEL